MLGVRDLSGTGSSNDEASSPEEVSTPHFSQIDGGDEGSGGEKLFLRVHILRVTHPPYSASRECGKDCRRRT